MFVRSTLAGLALALTATTAFAGASGYHSDQAVQHSGEAASHAGSAAASGAASVAAVPVVVVGGALAVTGSAIAEIGESAIDTGVDLSRVGQPATVNIIVTPDAAPTLD